MEIEKTILQRAKILKERVGLLRATGLVRYPKELREDLKRFVVELRTHNASWNDCGRLLGVSVSALHSWDKKPRKETGTGLVRVNIAPDVKPPVELSTLVLRTPSGYELSGFNYGQRSRSWILDVMFTEGAFLKHSRFGRSEASADPGL